MAFSYFGLDHALMCLPFLQSVGPTLVHLSALSFKIILLQKEQQVSLGDLLSQYRFSQG